MPKSPNQKLKLLYLMEILLQQTDERHPMTVPEMIAQLAQRGVSAERKSIYGDLEALRTFGLDIVQTKSKTTGYYVGTRAFETPELKLLVDSVQSSKFITHKKTLALIKKIEGLASIYDAQLLQRQVYVRGRVKSMNESVYYNVDEIADARKEFHDHIVDLIPVGDEHSHQRAEVQQHVVKLRDLRGPLHIQQMLGNGQMARGRDGQKFGNALHQSHDDGGKPGHSIHAPLHKNTDTL